MRLAEERRPIPGVLREMRRDARRVVRKLDAVREHAVRPHVLTCEHGRARRHAHRVLVVRALVVDAVCGEAIDDGCPCDLVAVAAQRVVALLVGGDEQDLPSHGNPSDQAARLSGRASTRSHARSSTRSCLRVDGVATPSNDTRSA